MRISFKKMLKLFLSFLITLCFNVSAMANDPRCSLPFEGEPTLEQYFAKNVNIDAETFYALNQEAMEDYGLQGSRAELPQMIRMLFKERLDALKDTVGEKAKKDIERTLLLAFKKCRGGVVISGNSYNAAFVVRSDENSLSCSIYINWRLLLQKRGSSAQSKAYSNYHFALALAHELRHFMDLDRLWSEISQRKGVAYRQAAERFYNVLFQKPELYWSTTFMLEDNARNTELSLTQGKSNTELSKLIYPEAEALHKFIALKYPKLAQTPARSLGPEERAAESQAVRTILTKDSRVAMTTDLMLDRVITHFRKAAIERNDKGGLPDIVLEFADVYRRFMTVIARESEKSNDKAEILALQYLVKGWSKTIEGRINSYSTRALEEIMKERIGARSYKVRLLFKELEKVPEFQDHLKHKYYSGVRIPN